MPVPVEQGSKYAIATKSGSLKEFVGEKQPTAHILLSLPDPQSRALLPVRKGCGGAEEESDFCVSAER